MSEVEPKDKLQLNRRRFLKLTLLSAAEGLLIACGRPASDSVKATPTAPAVRVITPPPNSTPLIRTTRTELANFDYSIDIEGGIAGITFDQPGNYTAGRFAHFLDANVLTRPKLPGGVRLVYPEKNAQIDIGSYIFPTDSDHIKCEAKLRFIYGGDPIVPIFSSPQYGVDLKSPIRAIWYFDHTFTALELNGIRNEVGKLAI